MRVWRRKRKGEDWRCTASGLAMNSCDSLVVQEEAEAAEKAQAEAVLAGCHVVHAVITRCLLLLQMCRQQRRCADKRRVMGNCLPASRR